MLAGCGADGEQSRPAPSGAESPEPSALARFAVAEPIGETDPLYARARSERIVSRQLYDPLTAAVAAPFAEPRRARGPARAITAARGGRLWRFELRPGLRFQDGSRLDAQAVIANVERWIGSGIAAQVLPELEAADSPRPGEVRLQLSIPVDDLPLRLERSELGLVSPRAIAARGTRPVRRGRAGSGAFEQRERESTRLLTVRNPQWWGVQAGLGTGVDRIEFLVVPDARGRADQLEVGVVDLADRIRGPGARAVAENPSLQLIGGAGPRLGASSAVRGVESARADQSLAPMWLTLLR